jgi:hypothetical protein
MVVVEGAVWAIFGHSLDWLMWYGPGSDRLRLWVIGISVTGITVILVSDWLTGIQMRRRISRDLGRKATDADLTSIETWIKVDKIKERSEQNKPLKPD